MIRGLSAPCSRLPCEILHHGITYLSYANANQLAKQAKIKPRGFEFSANKYEFYLVPRCAARDPGGPLKNWSLASGTVGCRRWHPVVPGRRIRCPELRYKSH